MSLLHYCFSHLYTLFLYKLNPNSLLFHIIIANQLVLFQLLLCFVKLLLPVMLLVSLVFSLERVLFTQMRDENVLQRHVEGETALDLFFFRPVQTCLEYVYIFFCRSTCL